MILFVQGRLILGSRSTLISEDGLAALLTCLHPCPAFLYVVQFGHSWLHSSALFRKCIIRSSHCCLFLLKMRTTCHAPVEKLQGQCIQVFEVNAEVLCKSHTPLQMPKTPNCVVLSGHTAYTCLILDVYRLKCCKICVDELQWSYSC